MSRQITGSLEFPAGTNFNGTIEARGISGSTSIVPQSTSEFPVVDALYDFTLDNGSYQFSIIGAIGEGAVEISKVKIGLGVITDGSPIDILTLVGLGTEIKGAPSILLQPDTVVSVEEGTKINLSIIASPAESFQWTLDNVDLVNEESPTLSLTSTLDMEGGFIRCVVGNGGESTTSNACAVTVYASSIVFGADIPVLDIEVL